MSTPEIVSPQVVRDLMAINVDATSRYTDATIGSNVRTSLEFIEQASGRYFADRPGITLVLTTSGQAAVALPGLRTITAVSWMDTPLDLDQTYWTYPDALGSGLIMAVGVRPFVARPGSPVWLSSPQWFDRGLDLHRYPADWDTGPWDQGSLTGDLVVSGDGGYAAGAYPDALLDAVKIMAAWKTKRPDAIYSGGFGTAEGSVFDLSELPVEVQRFVKLWRVGGTQAVSL